MPRPTIEVEDSLAHLHPEVTATWHPTENLPLRPETVLPGANDMVLWVCAVGHEERRRIADQVVNLVKCQACTYIGHTHPDIAAEVDVEFEPAGAAVQVPANSKKKLAWKCRDCGHCWMDAVKDRTAPGDAGCRRCAWGRWQLGMLIAHYRAAKGVSVEAVAGASGAPEAALVSQEAGRALLAMGVLRRVASYLSIPGPDWRCLVAEAHAGPPERGSPLFPRMRDGAFELTRKSLGSQRREFRKVLAGANIAELHATLAAEWHAELNAFTPYLVAPSARYNAFWSCQAEDCGNAWAAPVPNRTRSKRPSGCPVCAKATRAATRRATALAQGKSLAQFDRKIAKELDPAKNGGRTAHDLPFGCTDRVVWTCSSCDHEWDATVNKRTSGRGCPECWAARRLVLIHQRVRELVESGRNLEVEHPTLSQEFDLDLNTPLQPKDVAPRSSVKVWWRCRVNPSHVWDASPAHRTDPDNPRGCPYSPKPCGCVQAHPAYNLATERPYLKDEWHPDNEKGPEEYLPQSNFRAKWLCGSCDEPWETPIQVRYLGSDCPNCSIAQRSKTEIWLAFELAHFLPGIDPTLNANVATRNVDILSEPLKLVIEYDGHRYHSDPEKDILRGELLAEADYRVLTLRERPLARMGEFSMVVNGQAAFKYPHRLAADVLEYLQKRMAVPVADLAEYRAGDAPRARIKADAFIAGKKQRYGDKKNT